MNHLAFIGNLGTTEVILIVFVILLLFGAKRLPELARGLGKSMREFKKATTEAEETFRKALDDEKPEGQDAPKATVTKEKVTPEPEQK